MLLPLTLLGLTQPVMDEIYRTHTNQPRKNNYFEPCVMKINSLGAPRGMSLVSLV